MQVHLWHRHVKETMVILEEHPCWAAGVRADEAYNRRMMRAGRRYKERQQDRVSCPECRKDLTRGSMAEH